MVMAFKYFTSWMHHNLFLSTPLCEHLDCFHFFLLLSIPTDASLHTSLVSVFICLHPTQKHRIHQPQEEPIRFSGALSLLFKIQDEECSTQAGTLAT